MVQADHLRVVFRVGTVGFVMPVVDLLQISEISDVSFDRSARDCAEAQIGCIEYLDIEVPVHDFAGLLALAPPVITDESRCLVFSGADAPWGIVADRVDGIVNTGQLTACDLPQYFFQAGPQLYHSAALKDGEPLVCCEVQFLDAAWRGQ